MFKKMLSIFNKDPQDALKNEVVKDGPKKIKTAHKGLKQLKKSRT